VVGGFKMLVDNTHIECSTMLRKKRLNKFIIKGLSYIKEKIPLPPFPKGEKKKIPLPPFSKREKKKFFFKIGNLVYN
jgi:hypothetical protein